SHLPSQQCCASLGIVANKMSQFIENLLRNLSHGIDRLQVLNVWQPLEDSSTFQVQCGHLFPGSCGQQLWSLNLLLPLTIHDFPLERWKCATRQQPLSLTRSSTTIWVHHIQHRFRER